MGRRSWPPTGTSSSWTRRRGTTTPTCTGSSASCSSCPTPTDSGNSSTSSSRVLSCVLFSLLVTTAVSFSSFSLCIHSRSSQCSTTGVPIHITAFVMVKISFFHSESPQRSEMYLRDKSVRSWCDGSSD